MAQYYANKNAKLNGDHEVYSQLRTGLALVFQLRKRLEC